MKKSLLFLCFLFIGWSDHKPPKLLKVEADVQTWNEIINVIDLSAAEPTKRVAIKQFIIRQLSDTTINKK